MISNSCKQESTIGIQCLWSQVSAALRHTNTGVTDTNYNVSILNSKEEVKASQETRDFIVQKTFGKLE